MISTLTDVQRELAELAAGAFARNGSAEQIAAAEESPDGLDRALWSDLAATGLLGVAIPEEYDGLGFGAVEVALVCEQLGAHVTPVPLVATLTASQLLVEWGTDEQRKSWLPGIAAGEVVAAVAAPQSVVEARCEDGRLSGRLVGVAWAHAADLVIVPVGDSVVAVMPSADGITSHRGTTTAREIALDLDLTEVAAEPVGGAGAAGWLRERWFAALAATAAGVADGAVRLTASYTSEREQFGKPLSTFQSVALKAADAYLDATAIRAAARQAAWKLDLGEDAASGATLEVLTAAWWAAEAGQHAVHITQHLHGGMGADITYPVHRYFLWGKQIELLLGGASALRAELGEALEQYPNAGDAVTL
ncbi:MAG TPA: acyl-CoA dehydrogenase family protein [Mycobacteriales bacterium]|nr:acyl-CoA dehydrogenase family protein [Mycobacteriales bacterium]